MIVFVSDLWLDKPSVLLKFNQLLAGYATLPPTAFVLMGNFVSSGGNGGISKQSENLKELLSQLGDMIAEYEDLKTKSKFIFVPGKRYLAKDFTKCITYNLFSN
jgi:DNA polymerase epsilon subunit 2